MKEGVSMVRMKLRGGPFDGDESTVPEYDVDTCPEVLYAFACEGCKRRADGEVFCPFEGVHWCTSCKPTPFDRTELYWRSSIEGEQPPLRVYVHTDLPGGSIPESMMAART